MKLLDILSAGRPQVEHQDDYRFAQAILREDERAVRQLVDDYFPRLYRFALMRVNQDQELAEEVVQDTLAIAARRIETYRGEASLFTWLTQICRRELVRQFAKEKKRGERFVLFEDDPTVRAVVESMASSSRTTPFDETARDDVRRLVHLSLDQLPRRYAEVLEWKYIEGLTTAEIAAKTGNGYQAAESLLARARRAFKKGFQELLDSMNALEHLNASSDRPLT